MIDRVTIARLLSLNDSLDLFSKSGSGASDTLVRHGLVPALPISSGPRPVLVWGWKLVRQAAELGVIELETRSVDLDPVASLKIALQLENRVGHYSWAEQDAIARFFERSEHVCHVDVSSVSADRRVISRLVRGDEALFELTGRYRVLERHLRPLVDSSLISLRTAERIRQVPPEFLRVNRARIAAMSFSTRRQFLELLAELVCQTGERPAVPNGPSNGPRTRFTSGVTSGLGARGGAAFGLLMRSAASALKDPDPVSALRRLRFPALTALEDRFRQIRDDALGGTGVNLAAPEYFEGDSFSVSFRFSDCEELEQRIRELDRLKGCCEELFDFL